MEEFKIASMGVNISSYKNCCRTCLAKLANDCMKYNIFDKDINHILNFISLDIFAKGADLPNFICCSCATNLKNFWAFRHQVEAVQNILKEHRDLENSFSKNIEQIVTEKLDIDDTVKCEIKEEENNAEDDLGNCGAQHNSDNVIKETVQNVITLEKENSDRESKSEKGLYSLHCNKQIPKEDVNNQCVETQTTSEKTDLDPSCKRHEALKNNPKLHSYPQETAAKKFQCNKCGIKYVRRYDLVVHLRKHNGILPFACEICGKTFADQQYFKKHKRTHSDEKSHTCEFCHKSFAYSFTLSVHLRSHNGEKPFVCDKCGYCATTSTQLKVHMMRRHTKERPHKCNICPKAFVTTTCLANHMLTHTGQKKFFCTTCGRGVRTLSDLTVHNRTHTGEKPFACKFPDCNKKYKTWSHLCVHKKTHTGETKHQCTFCPKSFPCKTRMRIHMRIHTGEKPYVCTTCDAKFSQSGTLRHHKKIHSRNLSKT